MVLIAFIRHLQGFIGIKYVIRQFLASQDLIVDMIFECVEFLVEVQTEKNRKSTTKNRKRPEKTEKYRKKPNATSNIKFGTGFFRFFFRFFFGFLGCNPPCTASKQNVQILDHESGLPRERIRQYCHQKCGNQVTPEGSRIKNLTVLVSVLANGSIYLSLYYHIKATKAILVMGKV